MMVELTAYLKDGELPVEGVDSEMRDLRIEFCGKKRLDSYSYCCGGFVIFVGGRLVYVR